MGFASAIPWCHCTFNCWWGCVEVSPACDHCYARMWAHRMGYDVWGADGPRRFFGDEHWNEPFRWNRRAERDGARLRVFCMSMGDLGEERGDAVGRELDKCRQRLWFVIANTPHLYWLLLTKRPRFYRRLVPSEILALPNVWPGVTIESPEYLWRAASLWELGGVRGPKWISHEPALALTDFRAPGFFMANGIKWIVVGVESRGAKVGRADGYEAIARATLEQCRQAGAAFFHKQMPIEGRVSHDPAEWPEDLRVREFPR